MKTHIQIAVLFFLFSLLVNAQNIDIVKVKYGFLPAAKFKTPPVPALSDVETQISQFNLAVNYPVVLSEERTFLINSVSFEMLSFTFNNVPAQFTYLGPDKLYMISYSLGFLHKFNKQWGVNLLVKPVLASDLNNIDGDHIKIQGAGVVNYNLNENTQIGLGAAYNSDFGEPQLLPVVRLKYDNHKGFIINTTIPKSIEIIYSFSDHFDAGITGDVSGNQFRIGKEDSPSKGNSLKYSKLTLGPTLKYKITKNLSLLLTGGFMQNRIYESFDPDKNQLRDADLENGLFVDGGVSYSL
jgi:hypothetical protein